ncbi:MAG: hypothetical protein ABSA65_16390 [Acidimicrobiales bacterium]|jgi:hypothetical protein
MTARNDVDDDVAFCEALVAKGPSQEFADELHLFGQFVGSWDLEWIGRGPKSQREPMTGELYFGWVLEGRAVQDVWIVPGRGRARQADQHIGFHGSTVRFYDADLGVWRSTWIEPFKGVVRRFIGKPDGNDIVLVSNEETPQLRWRFTQITETSFVWLGETSHDRGATWELEEEMRATRLSS